MMISIARKVTRETRVLLKRIMVLFEVLGAIEHGI